jgi:hypothetical protein
VRRSCNAHPGEVISWTNDSNRSVGDLRSPGLALDPSANRSLNQAAQESRHSPSLHARGQSPARTPCQRGLHPPERRTKRFGRLDACGNMTVTRLAPGRSPQIGLGLLTSRQLSRVRSDSLRSVAPAVARRQQAMLPGPQQCPNNHHFLPASAGALPVARSSRMALRPARETKCGIDRSIDRSFCMVRFGRFRVWFDDLVERTLPLASQTH